MPQNSQFWSNPQLFQATFDAFTSPIAMLDRSGNIIALNQAWKNNSNDSCLSTNTSIGDNYISVCKTVVGSERELANLIASEIQAIANSQKVEFKFNYTNEDFNQTKWFVIHLKQVKQADWLGVLIIQENMTQYMQTESALRSVVEGTAAVTGQDFFRSLVYHLTRALAVNYAFVTKCLGNSIPVKVRTLAFWCKQDFGQNFEYNLANTPCQRVIGGVSCHYPRNLRQIFPQDTDLARLNAESYVGVPLINSSGRILGHLVVIDELPMKDGSTELAILKIFAARAAAELERQKVEEQLAYDALHDRLTDLPNRYLLSDHLNRALEKYRRNQAHKFAVFFLDLDRFKYVNDSLGHKSGDRLLIAISKRLKTCLRASDILARLGGDEFAILLEGIQTINEITKLAERIQQSLNSPFYLGIHEVFTSVSIGIAFSEPGIDSPEELLRNADIAMYKAKALGKTRYELFDETLHIQVVNQLSLETDFRRSLDRGEFNLYYQPIVSLMDNQVIGFEALVRWQHPQRGCISPEEFIPLAEETGMIITLGWWILQEACYQLREWQIRFKNPSLTMGVNISQKQFSQPRLADSLLQILRTTGLESSTLKLEITESLLMEDTRTTIEILQQLKALGCQLYLDDFGTGYSSLSYLHSLPIDALKIDRSFVAAIDAEGNNSELVEAIVMMA
ncbi:putative bifunctional diguanylate cyclase/phosphodiesterase, partial [Hyella patelloides]|uniref:putative bifunctional diguanylate cyclase/phosphodiesterase n=1 Tax=Hyella patelloides TaxID=1982969 RepID=UPI0011A7FDB4